MTGASVENNSAAEADGELQESNDMSNTYSDNSADDLNKTMEMSVSDLNATTPPSDAAPFGGVVASPFDATQEISASTFGVTETAGASDETIFGSGESASSFDDAETVSGSYLEEDGEFGTTGVDDFAADSVDDIEDVVLIIEEIEVPVPVPYPVPVRAESKTLARVVGEIGGGALNIVKENPVPAALTTLGLFSLVRGVRGGHKTVVTDVPYTGYNGGSSYSAPAKPSRPAPTTLVGGVTNAASDAATALVDIAKANPVPATAAVLSLFWLVQSQRKGGDGLDKVAFAAGKVADAASAVGDKVEALADAAKTRAGELIDHTKDAASGVADAVTDKVSGVADTVGDKATDAAQTVSGGVSGVAQTITGSVSGAAHTVADKATDAAKAVAEKATGAAQTVTQTASTAAQTVVGTTTETAGTVARLLGDNPIALALTALAVGVGLGFLLPETEVENNLMGETADRISDTIAEKARQATRDMTGKIEEAASGFSDQVLSNGNNG